MIFFPGFYGLLMCILSFYATAYAAEETVSAPSAVSTGKRWTIDKIVARVNGVNILQSDLKIGRIAQEGRPFTLDEAIVEELLYQRAAEMQTLPTAVEIDRQLALFKMQNNFTHLSDQEFEGELEQIGFTLKMYKNQLARMIAVENVKRAEISEKIIVTSQDVQEYYDKNPEYTREEYLLAVATLPDGKETMTEEELLNERSILWESLGWVARKELNKDFSSIVSVNKGHLSKPIFMGGAYQVLKLIDKKEKRLKTLDERYGNIERALQDGRREKFMNRFEKELKEKADKDQAIVYL